MNRRDFLAAASAAAAAAIAPAHGAAQARPTRLVIGCHTRPFSRFRLNHDDLLDAIKAAGFKSADMIRATVQPPPGASAPAAAGAGGQRGGRGGGPVTPESLAALKEKLAARGLTSTIANLSVPTGVPLADAIAATRQQIANAHTLGQKYALTLGLTQEAEYLQFAKVLSDAAAFGQERGVQVVMKHHHGLNNTAGELVGWVKQVNHPNFAIFYDAGNVVYYTGKDPVAQLEVAGPYVTGVVAKDCTAPQFQERRAGDPGFGTGAPDPGGNEVMIQFGTGKVDFAGMFKKLKSFGFDGPVMVEGTAVGATVQETIANARANREFLERLLGF